METAPQSQYRARYPCPAASALLACRGLSNYWHVCAMHEVRSKMLSFTRVWMFAVLSVLGSRARQLPGHANGSFRLVLRYDAYSHRTVADRTTRTGVISISLAAWSFMTALCSVIHLLSLSTLPKTSDFDAKFIEHRKRLRVTSSVAYLRPMCRNVLDTGRDRGVTRDAARR